MSNKVEIRVLGPLEVWVDGQPRALPKSRKTRALLALLALEPRPHSRSALAEWIWPDTADPRAALRWSLTKLRDTLAGGQESPIFASRDTVALDPEQIHTDRDVLTALLENPDSPTLDTLIGFEERFERASLAELDTGATSEFELWLESQRNATIRLHQKLLALLVQRLSGGVDATAESAPARALEFARKRLSLDPIDHQANLDLLRLSFTVQGRHEAQAVLERMRRRLLEAGLADTALLAAWRALSAGDSADSRNNSRIELLSASTGELTLPPGVVHTLPTKPSVAVLAFEDLGDHSSGDVLAEGIAVDLNSRLAQLKGLFVIARASATRFSLGTHDAPIIGRQLGVRYLIHGTTQRTANRLRVTVNLIEAEQGAEIWSNRFDRPLGDLFEVQDDMTNSIVSALEPQIDQAEMDRVRTLPTESLDAWECFHRAMWHGFRFTSEDNRLAQQLFQQALAQDPQFARAYAGLSFNHFSRAFLHASDDVPQDIRLALERAEQAVNFDGRDAMSHWALGRAQFLNREHDQAIDAIDRALVANPNYAQGHYARGFIGAHADLAEQAIAELEMAQRLSPFDPLLFAMKSSHGVSLAVQGNYPEAVAWAVRATQEPNAHFHIYAIAGACLELAGRSDEAEQNVRHALTRHPDYSIAVFERSFPYKEAAHRALISDALQRAGLRRH